jgi:hypothetical protein
MQRRVSIVAVLGCLLCLSASAVRMLVGWAPGGDGGFDRQADVDTWSKVIRDAGITAN